MSKLFTYLYFLCCAGNRQSLLVRVDSNEFDTLRAGANHSVYNVIASATNTNNFDRYNIFGTGFKLKRHIHKPPIF